MGHIRGDVAIEDENVVVPGQLQDPVPGFEAITCIEERNQKGIDLIEGTEPAIEEVGNAVGKGGFFVAGKADQFDRVAAVLEGFGEEGGLGSLAGTINALNIDQKRHGMSLRSRGQRGFEDRLPEQSRVGDFEDPNIDAITREEVVRSFACRRDLDRGITAGGSAQPAGPNFGGTVFDHQRKFAAEQGCVIFGGEFPVEFGEAIATFADDLFGDGIGVIGSRGSLARAEGEDVDFHESGGGTGVEGFLKMPLGFTGEADDDVSRKGGVIETLPELIDFFEESPDPVAASHAEEDFVGAALQGGVKVGAKPFGVGHHVDEVGTDFGGFDAGEPELPVSGNPIEFPNEVSESERRFSGLAAGRIDSEVPEVNATKNNFAVAVVDEPSNFLFDLVRFAASKTGADLGDDAVGTLENAAVLDFHERTTMAIEATDSAGGVIDAESGEKIGEFAFVGDDLDDIRQHGDHFGVAGGIAAHDDGLCIGVSACEATNLLTSLGVGFGGDGAGIDDAEFRRFVLRGFVKAVPEQRLLDKLGFVLIDFAAEGDEPARFLSGNCRRHGTARGNLRDTIPYSTGERD